MECFSEHPGYGALVFVINRRSIDPPDVNPILLIQISMIFNRYNPRKLSVVLFDQSQKISRYFMGTTSPKGRQ